MNEETHKQDEVPAGIYKHFKGMLVKVIGTALHSETQEEMVVYIHKDQIKGKAAGTMWVRPLQMFTETVARDGKVMKRFEFVE
jgi:hypothetical protein